VDHRRGKETVVKAIKLTMGLLLGAAAFSACDSGGGEYLKKAEEFSKKSCECKDIKCTQKVAEEQTAWLSKNAETAAKLSTDDAEKVAAANTKMAECISKIATEEAGAAAGGG
jgi:hypothetical protein